MNLQFFVDNFFRFNDNVRKFVDGRYFSCWKDEIYCALRFGCSPDDFFRYEFYKKSDFERDKFITYKRSQNIIRKYNDKEKNFIFDDKSEFNKWFKDYIKRDWIDLRTANRKDFESFLRKHGKAILKPVKGGQGRDIFILHTGDLETFEFEKYRDYIAEELLIQDKKMKKLNPSSVNTVRVLTFKGKIIACALRIGGDNSVVDNLHSNGVCAHLDLKKGVIDALCIDNKMQKYLYHPKTGIKLVGFCVPHWKEIRHIVLQASSLVPEVQYVGWDVAVLENGAAIIEGNRDPGHDVVQMIVQSGIYNKIRKYR